jgi:hypothetical protein
MKKELKTYLEKQLDSIDSKSMVIGMSIGAFGTLLGMFT